MKKKDIDMLNGPIVPSMIFFAIPMLISGLLQICFNAADTIVVGRFAGHTSMAAIGSTASITNLMVNLFIGISMGVNVVVARAIGRGDRDGIEKAYKSLKIYSASTPGKFLQCVIKLRRQPD